MWWIVVAPRSDEEAIGPATTWLVVTLRPTRLEASSGDRARADRAPGVVSLWEARRVWAPGDVIVHHEVWRGRVWAARPLVVVDDAPDRLLLWLPAGTVRQVPVVSPARPAPPTRREQVITNLASGDWVHAEHVWDVSTLWILVPGAWHAVWVSWLLTGQHFGWYVNLQRPYRRTAVGIESMDMMLDIVVDPSGRWRWKDDDEFDEIEVRGIFDSDVVRRVRNEAATAIAQIERRVAPFDETWLDWRPSPSWPRPVLPTQWDCVPS